MRHWYEVWQRFRRHHAVLIGGGVLGLMFALVLSDLYWTSYDPTRQQ